MLAFYKTAEQERMGEPDWDDLIAAVADAKGGIDATALSRTFESRGFHRYAVQRAIQRALDKGLLDLGPGLRLYRREKAA